MLGLKVEYASHNYNKLHSYLETHKNQGGIARQIQQSFTMLNVV